MSDGLSLQQATVSNTESSAEISMSDDLNPKILKSNGPTRQRKQKVPKDSLVGSDTASSEKTSNRDFNLDTVKSSGSSRQRKQRISKDSLVGSDTASSEKTSNHDINLGNVKSNRSPQQRNLKAPNDSLSGCEIESAVKGFNGDVNPSIKSNGSSRQRNPKVPNDLLKTKCDTECGTMSSAKKSGSDTNSSTVKNNGSRRQENAKVPSGSMIESNRSSGSRASNDRDQSIYGSNEASLQRNRKGANIPNADNSAHDMNSNISKSSVLLQQQNPKVLPELFTGCEICCINEKLKYAAIGQCDHPICSLCSLRMRVKSQDMNCPFCKQSMEVVIVYSTKSKGQHSFASYGITDVDCTGPGLDVDYRARMVFSDCKNHFLEMDKIRSLVCPLKKCGERFPAEESLLKHIDMVHPGQSLCILCLQNRPLFISEHTLMSKAELKKHLNAPPGSLTGAGGDKTAGHPLCLFCDEYYFDSQSLYMHMKREHQSCHLCNVNYQYRFYRSIDELQTHLSSEHFVCDICENARANGIEGLGIFGSSFRHLKEYASHMQTMHGVRNGSMALGFHGANSNEKDRSGKDAEGKGRHKKRSNNVLAFLDLDMTSADPNRSLTQSNRSSTQSHPQQRGVRTNQAHSQSFSRHNETPRVQHGRNEQESYEEEPTVEEQVRRRQQYLETSAAISAAPNVPAHMKIAGRIVAGRFQRHPDDDILQAAADEQRALAAAVNSTTRRGSWAGKGGQRQNLDLNFPSLSTNAAVRQKEHDGDAQKAAGSLFSPHPLSLVSGIQREAAAKQAKEREQTIKDQELNDKKFRRNQMIASALGMASLTTADDIVFDSNELQRPLYPSLLLNWARNNKVELQKLEKKMLELISDKTTNSSQLKPMGPGTRQIVHGLSRYYSLNSYEFDPEPRRYVSQVKDPQSSVPMVRLSSASLSALLPPANVLSNMCISAIYVSVMNPLSGFTSTEEVRGKRKPDKDTLIASLRGIITSGDVITRVTAVLKAQTLQFHPYSHPQAYRISAIKAAGASAVCLIFSDMRAAVTALDMISGYKKNPIVNNSDIIPGLLDMFLVEPAFDPDLFKDILEEQGNRGQQAAFPESPASIPFGHNSSDPESAQWKSQYTLPMPVPRVSGIYRAPRPIVPPPIPIITEVVREFDESIAASLREEWASLTKNEEDEKSDEKEKKNNSKEEDKNEEKNNGIEASGSDLFKTVSGIPPPGLSPPGLIPPSFSPVVNSRITPSSAIDPSSAINNLEISGKSDSNEEERFKVFEKNTSSSYRHLVLQSSRLVSTPVPISTPHTDPV